MAFTQDELQAFNTILEQKLAQHRHEVERSFDQRLHLLHRELEQHFIAAQQEALHALMQQFTGQQKRAREVITQSVEQAQVHVVQAVGQEVSLRLQQHQQNIEALIERTLAAQLIAVEQLLTQHSIAPSDEAGSFSTPLYRDASPDFEAIEVQTELPWEDFVDVIGRALDERLSALDVSLQSALKHIEHHILTRLRELHSEIQTRQHSLADSESSITNMQDVFTSLERLEHIIESMQVAMTTNHALLSNRLYHHQQLPLERAHAAGQRASSASSANSSDTGPLPLTKK